MIAPPTAPDGSESPAEVLDRLAHDVRTPLATLLLWTRLLRSGEAPPQAALDAIERSALTLSTKLDELGPLAERLREAKPPRSPRKRSPRG